MHEVRIGLFSTAQLTGLNRESFDSDGSEVWYSALRCEALMRIYPLVAKINKD